MENHIKLPLLSSTSSPSPFVSIPLELKQIIFSAFPDVNTLKCVISTCSSFYHAFRHAESLVITSIIHNQIGSALIYDAFIVSKSTLIPPKDHDAAIDLLKLYAKRDLESLTPKWNLSDALAIDRLHDDIEYFTNDFTSVALSTNPVTRCDEESPSALSVLESRRIKQAFYRFELVCNLCSNFEYEPYSQPSTATPLGKFVSLCTPWQIEQLACVRDYLFDRLSLPFNDVAEHDIEWGELRKQWLDEEEMQPDSQMERLLRQWLDEERIRPDPRKEHYLGLGLSYLHRLVLTSDFDDRCHLLKAFKEGPERPFSDACWSITTRHTFERVYSNGEQYANILAQRTTDGDAGPEEAWRWADCSDPNPMIRTYWRRLNEQRNLRHWGYVMWDLARLVRWDIFNHDWNSLPRHSFIDGQEAKHRRDVMRSSFAARHEIWVRGGRGWWSTGDESRIIWPPRGPIEIP